VVGALTLIPWLVHTLEQPGTTVRSWSNLLPPRFWIFYISNTLGLSLLRLPPVGSPQGFSDSLLAWPTFHGSSLYLVEIAVVVICVVGVAIATLGLTFAVWPRVTWRRPGQASDSRLSTAASAWGFGLLLTVTGALIYRHYLIVTFALPFVVVAAAALVRPRWGRGLLAALVIAQAALSVLYLDYVHVRGGAVGGDYGVPYDRQAHIASRQRGRGFTGCSVFPALNRFCPGRQGRVGLRRGAVTPGRQGHPPQALSAVRGPVAQAAHRGGPANR
jgi:hypothetical protein